MGVDKIQVQVLGVERGIDGDVFFFYRPKVEKSEEERGQHQRTSLQDVAKFYLLLSPTNTTRDHPPIHSLVIMIGKMHPQLTQHDRRGAFVELVSTRHG